MRDLIAAQEHMLDITSLRVLDKQDALCRLSTESEPTEFPLGSFVCLRYPTHPPSKLHDRLAGPFMVDDIKGNLYRVRDLTCERYIERDVSFLVPFLHIGTEEDMMRITAADLDETAVVKIDDVRGTLSQRSTLEFQVHWADGEVSWEPWETVRKTAELSQFLQERAYKSLLDAASSVPPSK